MIAKRFNVNPAWKIREFDEDAVDTVDELYAIHFENGLSQPTPNVRFTAQCIRETFRFDMVKLGAEPSNMRLTSQEVEYEFLGERLKVSSLTNEYTEMSIHLIDEKRSKSRKGKSARKRRDKVVKPHDDVIRIELAGTPQTVRRVWAGGEDLLGQVVLSPQSKVEFP